MTPDEAQELLEIAAGNWPAIMRDPLQVKEWLRRLGPSPSDVAIAALEDLLERCDYPPTRAEWQESMRLARKRVDVERLALPAAPRDEAATRAGLAHLGGMWARVAEVESPTGHDHHNGPGECPVCSSHDQPHNPHTCGRCRMLGEVANGSTG